MEVTLPTQLQLDPNGGDEETDLMKFVLDDTIERWKKEGPEQQELLTDGQYSDVDDMLETVACIPKQISTLEGIRARLQ